MERRFFNIGCELFKAGTVGTRLLRSRHVEFCPKNLYGAVPRVENGWWSKYADALVWPRDGELVVVNSFTVDWRRGVPIMRTDGKPARRLDFGAAGERVKEWNGDPALFFEESEHGPCIVQVTKSGVVEVVPFKFCC